MIDELSIVIPTLNEEHYLYKLLNSIVKQNFPGKLQIIVVDGGSEDRTIEIAESFHSEFQDFTVVQTDRGVGFQRNKGASHAKYKYLLFLDADMVLSGNFFHKFLQKIDPSTPFIVSTTILPLSKDPIDFFVVACAIPLIRLLVLFFPLMPGGLTFTTKMIHDKIGGYVEGFVFGEDNDYGERSVKAGAKYALYFNPIVYTSVRRARERGRVGLLFSWLMNWIYIKRYGLIEANKRFNYPYGHYKGEQY